VTEQGPSTYDEPARSYAGLLVVAAFFAAAMTLDGALGGLVAHLIGWLVAVVLVAGTFALIIYAARSEKSLHVSADELWIGDEVVPRSEVVAVAEGADDDELPVLGWPTGAPRGVKAVTIRLADGRDVVVPTRFPDRLMQVLGVATVAAVRHGPDVRAAESDEFPLLGEIAERAEALFRTAGYQLPDIPFDATALATAKAVFVAGQPPVGFVQVDEVDGSAHVAELAVIPKWMRQGIGTRLIEQACEWAREHDYPAITLITYADVPWNGPYYTARGFVEIDDLSPQLATRRQRQRDLGLDEVGRRIVMRRDLP
jgi:GNAT superfamily N-acetyltransferase